MKSSAQWNPGSYLGSSYLTSMQTFNTRRQSETSGRTTTMYESNPCPIVWPTRLCSTDLFCKRLFLTIADAVGEWRGDDTKPKRPHKERFANCLAPWRLVGGQSCKLVGSLISILFQCGTLLGVCILAILCMSQVICFLLLGPFRKETNKKWRGLSVLMGFRWEGSCRKRDGRMDN